METIELTVDLALTRMLFERYFKFELRRELKKVPIYFLLGMSTVLILLGLFSQIELLWILGIIFALLVSLFLLFYLIRFKIASTKILKYVLKKASAGDKHFVFSFDSVSINYKSDNKQTDINWELIKKYFINEKDVYLYLENQELLDIISESIIGEEKFNKFIEILKEKCSLDPKSK